MLNPQRPTEVLIVQDHDALRETLCLALESEGYVVSTASNGKLALDRLRMAAQPLVVLLDWMMPEMNGFQVLETMAAEAAAVPAHEYIFMSAALNTPDFLVVPLATDLSVTFLAKPFDLEKLLTAVAQAATRLRAAA
jgi:two-component system alkaline phosphatase synthesis response regulator PhoP